MASVNKVILAILYLGAKKSIPDIAQILGLSPSSARKALIDAGIRLRTRADGVRAAAHKLGVHARGKKRVFSDEWKDNIRQARIRYWATRAAGLSYKRDRYVQITRGTNKGRSQHVVLMEEHLGRRLLPNEVVHHKDGNKHNNLLENLELMTRSDHTKHHRQEEKNGKR